MTMFALITLPSMSPIGDTMAWIGSSGPHALPPTAPEALVVGFSSAVLDALEEARARRLTFLPPLVLERPVAVRPARGAATPAFRALTSSRQKRPWPSVAPFSMGPGTELACCGVWLRCVCWGEDSVKPYLSANFCHSIRWCS